MSILIIGAGASGILTAVKLLKAGHTDVTILEKAADLGGTWRDNTYPGAACDVPSHLYSFSFEPNPDWSRVYAPQAEILAYLQRVARKYALHIRFGQEVTRASWQGTHWHVETKTGVFGARFLFMGTGGLERPHDPEIEGLEAFAGPKMHSARWNSRVNLKNKRVAVIGSAASAVQIVPEIAKEASQLLVFQRTPNWVVPRHDRSYTALEKALFRIPALQRAYRAYIQKRLDFGFALFRRGSLLARIARHFTLKNLRRQIPDPQMQRALTPDYPMGCKRILLSDDYYPALLRPNVELITEPIRQIHPTSIQTLARTHEIDVLILATGFHVFNVSVDVYAPQDASGGTGALPSQKEEHTPSLVNSIRDVWKEAPEAYRGVTVSGFPNLFLLLGPNSALGHSSVWLMTEAQADYAVRAIHETDRRKANHITLKSEIMRSYNARIQRELKGLVWTAGCKSWYQTDAGKNFTIYPGTVGAYQTEMAGDDWGSYEFGGGSAQDLA